MAVLRKPVPVYMGSARFRTVDCAGWTVTEAWFPAGTVLPAHTHDRAIFAVTLDGVLESAIANRHMMCGPATVWTEPTAERHSNTVGRVDARVVVVQPDHASDAVDQRFLPLLEGVSCRRHAGIAADAGRIVAELDIADDVSGLAIDGLVCTMLASGSRLFRRDRHHARPPAWLLDVQELLHDRFREHLDFGELAAAAGVQPATLARAFRRHFGTSPGDYQRNLRVRWAAERLSQSTMAIGRIALQAGFSDQSHLTREFRRRLGVPPAAYRHMTGQTRRDVRE
jgi:AraC family transcriptional regulator